MRLTNKPWRWLSAAMLAIPLLVAIAGSGAAPPDELHDAGVHTHVPPSYSLAALANQH
jgi:hypothetical protein